MKRDLTRTCQTFWTQKKQDKFFDKTVSKYSNPTWAKVLGVIMVLGLAIVAPMFGWWVMETMNNMNLAAFNRSIAEGKVDISMLLDINKSATVAEPETKTETEIAADTETEAAGTEADSQDAQDQSEA